MKAAGLLALIEAVRPNSGRRTCWPLPPCCSQAPDRPRGLIAACVAFGALCLAAGACYLVNDVADAERDRLHPGKAAVYRLRRLSRARPPLAPSC